jgi:hypothetical protein
LILRNGLVDQLFAQIGAQDVDRFVSGHEFGVPYGQYGF